MEELNEGLFRLLSFDELDEAADAAFSENKIIITAMRKKRIKRMAVMTTAIQDSMA